VTVFHVVDPPALVSVIVSVLLPSEFNTMTSVSVRLNTPAPVGSHCVVFDNPLVLVVTTVLSSSAPFALESVIVLVRLPSPFRTNDVAPGPVETAGASGIVLKPRPTGRWRWSWSPARVHKRTAGYRSPRPS